MGNKSNLNRLMLSIAAKQTCKKVKRSINEVVHTEPDKKTEPKKESLWHKWTSR